MPKKTLDIEPVSKRQALPEQIVRQLVGLVRSGELKPGDRLPAERALADELGVGRPTLREALRALQLLGILDIRHGGGVFVSELEPDTLLGPLDLFVSLDRHSLDTILEARRVIEGALLAFVAKVIDDRLIAKLEANLTELGLVVEQSHHGNVDARRVNDLAQEFRGVIEEAVDNPILTRAVKSLDVLSAATRNKIIAVGSLDRLVGNHKRMVDALIAHDPLAAQQALEAHIDYLCEASNVSLREKS
ncbi:MAG TPA: FadR/GntR family transcriptional regulator [Woeseiaceae bacterium]|nr:FadR/GntR family transcriptional regulator [Woeseiaceae bacterium]